MLFKFSKTKENDFTCRCMPPARCVPVVKNNLVVTSSLNIYLTAELPKTGSSFDVTYIIGRCVSPCSCANDQSSNKVCGSDGRTYDSECHAECAGISVSQMLR